MKTRVRIFTIAVLLLSIGLTLFLQQTIDVSAQDVIPIIAGPEGEATNVSPIPITITFEGDVVDFTIEDIVVDNGEKDNFDATNAPEYSVEVTPDEEGIVTVDVPADAVDGGNLAAVTYSVVYDISAPTVLITSSSPNITGNLLIPFKISFDEMMDDLETSYANFVAELTITNGVLFGPIVPDYNAQTIDFTVTAQDFGDVIVTVPANIFSDLAGNKNLETIKTIEYVDQPWVTIEQGAEQLDPTPVPPIIFDVLFSEEVTEFETEDVDLSGTTAPGELIVEIQAVPDTLNQYTVSVSGMTGPGLVKASVPADVVEDDEENLNLPSTSVDNEVTFEGPVPTVLAIELVQINPTQAEAVNFYVTFSEDVNSVEIEDFVLATTGDISGASIQYVVGDEAQRFVSVLTGSGAGTIRLDVAADAEILDSDGFSMIDLPFVDGEAYDVRIESFGDVNTDYWAWQWIERLYDNGVTTGCSQDPLSFCPDEDVTRAEMAKFILAALHVTEEDYAPPELEEGDETGFEDVASDYWAAAWIKELLEEELTNGCAPGLYCPEDYVTRAEMAKFILSTLHMDEDDYAPPELVEGDETSFDDVAWDYWAATWIKQLAEEDLTNGCAPGLYCPDENVTRAEMAKFLVETFDLP